MKKLLVILSFFISITELRGQGWLTEENAFETNWNVTLQIGPNMLLGEMKKNLSGLNSNMVNNPGFGANIQLSKMAWERIDIGLETGFMQLTGTNKNPSIINYLTLSGKFNNENRSFLPYPVIYSSSIFNLALFTKYNFINFSTYYRNFIKINMFLRFGIGLMYLNSELGYQENVNYQLSGIPAPLFSTDEIRFLNKINAYIFPAVGVNYQMSERIFFSAEMSFQAINSDLIDGVFNVNNNLPAEYSLSIPKQYKIPVFDITGKFMLGCTYYFNFDTQRKALRIAYPWYNNRYRSYFSKYHTPASKRIIKERLPFYNNKFDE